MKQYFGCVKYFLICPFLRFLQISDKPFLRVHGGIYTQPRSPGLFPHSCGFTGNALLFSVLCSMRVLPGYYLLPMAVAKVALYVTKSASLGWLKRLFCHAKQPRWARSSATFASPGPCGRVVRRLFACRGGQCGTLEWFFCL